MSRNNRPPVKDMYWFAHGGAESDKPPQKASEGEDEGLCTNSPTLNFSERKASPDDLKPMHLHSDSSGPPSLEREDRLRTFDKRLAVEERRKQLAEAEQEKNDALLRRHLERDAALEARRNAQRSNISFAFGRSVPRNVEAFQANDQVDTNIMSRSFTAGILSPQGEDLMSQSMTSAASSGSRGRRKNDLMPTVPYERITAPHSTASTSRKRSVSMTRLDQLALPRKHYLEANKASKSNATASNGSKDGIKSPGRPLSSASEHSGGSGRTPTSVTRRVRSSPRKPRPVSIAGTAPEIKSLNAFKPFEVRASPTKRSYTPAKKSSDSKALTSTPKATTPKLVEKTKQALRPSTAPKATSSKPLTPKPATPKPAKLTESKFSSKLSTTPKAPSKPMQPTKKKKEPVVASTTSPSKENENADVVEKSSSPVPVDSDTASESEKSNAKKIISEEEARAALAEKRRLAREQAEKEAELERQRQEELRLAEEERVRLEEEEHQRLEEEQLHLQEEHRRQEEEKLRRAIEEREQREEEERTKRDEENKMKAEQERKAKEEAEKQKLELEEKLRKEEEERAERKKRLEKIMSRTRGKSNGTSPSGSVSGSDQLDAGDNALEGFSSGANSLDSNEAGELNSEPAEISDLHPAYDLGSENGSLNSNDLMMPVSENASQDNSLLIVQEDGAPMIEEKILEVIEGKPDSVTSSHQEEVQLMPGDKGTFQEVHSEDLGFNSTALITETKAVEEQDQDGFSGDSYAFKSFNANESNSKNFKDDFSVTKKVIDSMLSESMQSEGFHHQSHSILNFQSEPVDEVTVTAFGRDEPVAHGSFSDIKLPDPIYETSDDRSILSEKQMENYQVIEQPTDTPTISDDVFAEQALEQGDIETNPFGNFDNSSMFSGSNSEGVTSKTEVSHQNDFEPVFGDMNNSMYIENESNILPDPMQEPFDYHEDNTYPSPRSSTSSVIEMNANFSEPQVVQNQVSNLFDSQDCKERSNELESNEKEVFEAHSISTSKDNIVFESATSADMFKTDKNFDLPSTGDNPFSDMENSVELKSSAVPLEAGDYILQQSNELEPEQHEMGNVTLIKSGDTGACVGIISSLDHDQACNDTAPNHGFLRNSNHQYECTSITDSEDSSLDSNLSQVMTGEEIEKEGGVDPSENSKADYSSGSIFNIGLQHKNPFEMDHVYNDNTKSNGSDFTTSEVFSNGHSNVFSKHADGSEILSVDPVVKNNIFESVDAIGFGKESPDPFLGKGNSISGNPFHIQEEQKSVFMTQDFLN